MTAGRLAASKPGATTSTILYSPDIDNSASVVLTAANHSGSGVTYRAALRDYDQILTLDGDETTALEFQKGNPVSEYKLKISPGISFTDATPGADITTQNGATAKLLDVFKDTALLERWVKVEKLLETTGDNASLTGIFQVGVDTVTGGTSGVAGTLRSLDTESGTFHVAIADVASGATAVNVSRNTGLADAARLMISDNATETGTEIISIDASGINTTTNVLTVTRGVYGTTASAIPAGAFAKCFIDSATTSTINEGATFAAGDTTLTLADATGFLEGGFIQIGNETIQVSAVAGNDLTVVRGMYGTSAVNHNDGTTVTQLTDAGDYHLNFFTEGETITGGTSNATLPLNFSQLSNPITNQDRFIVAEGASGNTYELYLNKNLNNERTYRFWQTDASNTGHPFRLSEETDGTQSLSGTEYTTNVTKVGTAGQAGCYLEIEITATSPLSLSSYAEPAVANTADSNAGFGWSLNVVSAPAYEEIFIYKLRGAPFAAADQFTLGETTYTIEPAGVTAGPWGYVHEFDKALNLLKVSLDGASEAFVAGDAIYDTPTIANENRVMATVVAGKGRTLDSVSGADGSRAAGTYTGLTPTGGNGTLLKVDVTVDGSGAATVTLINGGKNYQANDTVTLTDSVLGGGGGASLTFDVATIGTGQSIGATATTYVNDEDYFAYGKAIAANAVDRTTGIVVGPGQNVLVYSSAADISYNVTGFESQSDDYTQILNSKTTG